MNVSSEYIRNELKVFDSFFNKVSKKALLRDAYFYVPFVSMLMSMVQKSLSKMSDILGVAIDELENVHTGTNGRFDCDNYAILGCSILKALHDRQCRIEHNDHGEFAIWPMARSDVDHTQAICLTDKGWWFVEFMTGDIWSMNDEKPEILLVG